MNIKTRKSKISKSNPMSVLKELLSHGKAGTQEELRFEMEQYGFDITQSTISRYLKKIGAIKTQGTNGEALYQLSGLLQPPGIDSSLADLIIDITHNEYLIVIYTAPGSASLIARHLDQLRSEGILGTIAGDDTIFVAPESKETISTVIQNIKNNFQI